MRSMSDTARIVAHVSAEQRARVGVCYQERAAEAAWVAAHLPTTRREFLAVLDVVRSTSAGISEDNVAAILLGARRPDARAATWLRRPARKAGHYCMMCGAAATSRANFGWACEALYDSAS